MRVSWTGLLTQGAVAADSDLGTFVGIAAYEAAGGTVTRDLFSGDEEGFMDDAALSRLVIESATAAPTASSDRQASHQ